MDYNKLMKEPMEGFKLSLKNDDIYCWGIAIFGPPMTIYEGGYFKAEIKFPQDYPYRYCKGFGFDFGNLLPERLCSPAYIHVTYRYRYITWEAV